MRTDPETLRDLQLDIMTVSPDVIGIGGNALGFQAPSADEVYRYVFRLDDTARSLTDRFNWSIVFVNDTSSLCKEFLHAYCADICYRTADRIRFIFFSELRKE